MNPEAIFPITLAVIVSAWWIAMKVMTKSRKGERITGSIAILPVVLIAAAVALALAL
jgi:hypothetical protein